MQQNGTKWPPHGKPVRGKTHTHQIPTPKSYSCSERLVQWEGGGGLCSRSQQKRQEGMQDRQRRVMRCARCECAAVILSLFSLSPGESAATCASLLLLVPYCCLFSSCHDLPLFLFPSLPPRFNHLQQTVTVKQTDGIRGKEEMMILSHHTPGGGGEGNL